MLDVRRNDVSGYLAIAKYRFAKLRDFKMLFLSVLFVIVLFILGFALTSDKGKNTVHARKSGAATDLSNISKETRPNSVQIN